MNPIDPFSRCAQEILVSMGVTAVCFRFLGIPLTADPDIVVVTAPAAAAAAMLVFGGLAAR